MVLRFQWLLLVRNAWWRMLGASVDAVSTAAAPASPTVYPMKLRLNDDLPPIAQLTALEPVSPTVIRIVL
jgi:hypothetical protein